MSELGVSTHPAGEQGGDQVSQAALMQMSIPRQNRNGMDSHTTG
jgi:hypothetical protein